MKMPRRLRIPFAISIVGIALLTQPAFSASVTLRVASVEGKAGDTVDVPITAVAAPGLSAIHLELTYDPAVVTPDTVNRGTLAGSNALVDFNGADPGRLLIGIATLDPIKGDGPLAIARFKVTGKSGTTTALTPDNCKAWESGTHAEVLVTTEPGKVTIPSGVPYLLLILLAVIIVCVIALLILIVFLLRRRAAEQTQGAPAPPAQAGNAFRKAEDDYFRLKGQLSAGRISQAQFEAAMKNLMVQDAHGRYWTVDTNTGRWLVHDGRNWVEAQPY